ncbi:MAG: hypothetical protein AB7O24_10965 [Kofleriaceae bacterium]
MTCPAFERIAAAASDEDDAVLAHVTECPRCGQLFDAQHDVRDVVRAWKPAPLSPQHRDRLGGELLAAFDRKSERRLRRSGFGLPAGAAAVLIASVAAAAVIGIAGVAAVRGPDVEAPAIELASEPEPTAGHVRVVRSSTTEDLPEPSDPDRDEPQPPPAIDRSIAMPSAQLAGVAVYAHESQAERDVVRLERGELTIDAIDTRPVSVIAGDTSIAVTRARVSVIARSGVIHTLTVMAGSAEILIDGRREVIFAGTIWERDAARDAALEAFRAGWTAKRAGRGADAIREFDRATHPVVAEDAAYWAAIETERMGDRAGAARRYRAFIEQFPRSVRMAAVKAALIRTDALDPPYDGESEK